MRHCNRTLIRVFVSICLTLNFLDLVSTWLLTSGSEYGAILSYVDKNGLEHCAFPSTLKLNLTPCYEKGESILLELQRNDVIQSNVGLYSVSESGKPTVVVPDSLKKQKEGVIHDGYRWFLINTRTESKQSNFTSSQPSSCTVRLKQSPGMADKITEYSFSGCVKTQTQTTHKDKQQKSHVEIHTVRNIRDVFGGVTSYTVEVLIVIDYSVYKKWLQRNKDKPKQTKLEIQNYYSQVINGVDLRYRNIVFLDFAIRIKPVGFVIADSPSIFPWTVSQNQTSRREQLDADNALKKFRKWLNKTNGLPEHDHAIFFTSHDLYTVKEKLGTRIKHTSGLAYIGAMCHDGDSISIVEEQGGFQSVGTVAHEIGHSLGARHDGEDNSCRSEDRYIMAASGIGAIPYEKRFNPWHFSDCSIEYFREFIASLLVNNSMCLLDSRSDGSGIQKNSIPGQMYNADEQCRLIWGSRSYLCRGAEFGNASSICTSMYCRDPSTDNDCVLHTAARGTSCGNKQWCIEGQCTYSKDAPENTDGCLLGDQPGAAFNGMSCKQLVAQSPSYCYQAKVVARCCSSCRKHFTWRKGCEYGDKIQGCEHWHCNHMFGTRNVLADCCSTCNVGDVLLPTVPPDWYTGTHITTVSSGTCIDKDVKDLKCEFLVEKYGKYMCYNPHVSKMCCHTCKIQEDSLNKECPFGDRSPALCEKISHITPLYCSKYRLQCCFSCLHEPNASVKTISFSGINYVLGLFTFLFLRL